MASPSMRRCKAWAFVTGSPLAVTEEIVASQPSLGGRSFRHDLFNAHSRLLVEPKGHRRRQWSGRPRQAQVGAADATFCHKRGHDLPGNRIDRDSQADADPSDRRIDSDHLTRGDNECPAGVAGIECGVRSE